MEVLLEIWADFMAKMIEKYGSEVDKEIHAEQEENHGLKNENNS